MTTKGASDSSQAVYRPSEAGPSQSVQDGNDHTHTSTPPPYSGPSSHSIPQAVKPASYPALPKLNYALYSPPNYKLSSDRTTITTYKPEPNVYPAVLMSIIQAQAALPPLVHIHVKGIGSGATPDFHLKLNMLPLFIGDKEPQKRWNYLKVIDSGEMGWRGETKKTTEPHPSGGIDEWVKRYCSDTSAIKQFTLERIVSNWDTAYIEGRLHSLIGSIGYRGQVEITFPMAHNQVVIHSPDKVNRLFTNMTHLFTGTKKYAVVKAVWPYASVPLHEEGRVCAVQSEESWWNEWKDAVRYAILTRRKGWVTVEDQLEVLMGLANAPERWSDGCVDV